MADDTVSVKIVADTAGLDQLSAKIGKADVDLSKFGATARAQIAAAAGLNQATAQAAQQAMALGSSVELASQKISHGMGDVKFAVAGGEMPRDDH